MTKYRLDLDKPTAPQVHWIVKKKQTNNQDLAAHGLELEQQYWPSVRKPVFALIVPRFDHGSHRFKKVTRGEMKNSCIQ